MHQILDTIDIGFRMSSVAKVDKNIGEVKGLVKVNVRTDWFLVERNIIWSYYLESLRHYKWILRIWDKESPLIISEKL